jgi:KDO2-lipid IV(A) lauroyltransferase
MSLLGLVLDLISRLPFPVLHFFSDVSYFWIYTVFGYRQKTVRANLLRSFPEKSLAEIIAIEKGFFRNFCDLIFETIKTSTISKEEIQARCKLQNPEVLQQLYREGKNVAGISSHMGNWEWLSLALSLSSEYKFLAVYKPLANAKLNRVVIGSRERFGAIFVAIKHLKTILDQSHEKPYFVGLLSDQAPHDYSKAMELPFLNQPTFFVPGPGMLCLKRNLTPVYGWIRRVGRSQYTWHLELLGDVNQTYNQLSESERVQVDRFAAAHRLNQEDGVRAFVITRKLAQRLEEEIKMAPQDWLWSHRRWKLRN